MPELPEVETTVQGILPHIEGHFVSNVHIRESRLRWTVPENLNTLLKGKKVLRVFRRAKYIVLKFTQGYLLIHLGMSGSLRVVNVKEKAEKHDHVDICFRHQRCLRLRDPRKFGSVLWCDRNIEQHRLIKNLGPEPLSDAFNTDYLFLKSRNRRVAIKQFVMDSKVVVGVGNIYASESLFLAGIHPESVSGKISKKRMGKLVESIKTVLTRAIKEGGTTLRDFTNSEGKPGYFAQQLNVYGRKGEPCYQCSKPVKQKILGQRSSFYCSVCQT